MITKNQYDTYKPQIQAYEAEQARIAKYKGKSVCPFCGGSKTAPFVRAGNLKARLQDLRQGRNGG